MNCLKDKKERILFGIALALLLLGFPIILLSQEVEGYPRNIMTDLGALMGMIGGGLMGLVLVFPLVSRRQCTSAGSENRLKRKAWRDFRSTCVITAGALLMFAFLTYANVSGAMGARFLLTGLLFGGICAGAAVFCQWNNKSCSSFDERELHLIQRAATISNAVFMIYVFVALTAAFYLIGGRGTVPMWSIPLALYVGVLFAGTVQSVTLLRYAKEDDE